MEANIQKILNDAHTKPFLELSTTIEVLFRAEKITHQEYMQWVEIEQQQQQAAWAKQKAVLFGEVMA